MKKFFTIILIAVSFLVAGCENKASDRQSGAVQQPSQFSQTGVVGEFRLVKVEGGASVFVVQNGKKSPVASWNWVVLNAPNKVIETITKPELDSFTDSGITYNSIDR